MKENYYENIEIGEKLKAIKIDKVKYNIQSALKDFFRIVIHQNIPYEILKAGYPVLGLEMLGRNITLGENRALANYVSTECSSISSSEINFEDLLESATQIISKISAIFR